MKNDQINLIEKIQNSYVEKKSSKLDELKALDKKAKRPTKIFAYTFGTIGALVLGTGMCLAMKVIGNSMALGIIIGVIGIALTSVTYPIYKALSNKRKNKYSKQILELSSELLNK